MSELKVLSEKELNDRVGLLVGTRPAAVMMSSLIKTFKRSPLESFVIHSGQHFSYNMDKQFFENLDLPLPEYRLENVKDCILHGEQTAEMIKGIEQVLIKERPKFFIVAGDTNTNLAGALAAKKLGIFVGHVEAGERCGNPQKPEEMNRVMIDHISDYLFVTNKKGEGHLKKENVYGDIFITGNPIVDALFDYIEVAREKSKILTELGVEPNKFFIVTVHREENTDDKDRLENIVNGIIGLSMKFKEDIVFLIHPRTQKRLQTFGLENKLEQSSIRSCQAIGYLDFINLLSNARLCITDSCGVQQEGCILQVPCVTLDEFTEWTETIDIGSNVLSGITEHEILDSVQKMYSTTGKWENPFGDGKTGQHICDFVKNKIYPNLAIPS